MNIQDIAAAIRVALQSNGIQPANSDYDDSQSLVSVYPESKWADAECLICIYADRVQKWQRNMPFNYTTGFAVGPSQSYTNVDQMISIARSMITTPRSHAWG